MNIIVGITILHFACSVVQYWAHLLVFIVSLGPRQPFSSATVFSIEVLNFILAWRIDPFLSSLGPLLGFLVDNS